MKPVVVIIVATIATTLIVAANWGFPKPPMIPTGEIVCRADGRCAEAMKRAPIDMGNPAWVDFTQGNYVLTLAVIFFDVWAGVEASALIALRRQTQKAELSRYPF